MTRALLALALAGCAVEREWVELPGGRREFVRVSGGTWLAARETTWEDFDAFYERPEEEAVDGVTRPSIGKSYLGLSGLPPESMEAKRPVVAVRWHSAMAYCEWLTRKTGKVFRLPTESEWRAGDVGGGDVWDYLLAFPPVQIGVGRGPRGLPDEWIQADPNRPASVWWFRTDFSQGFRVARVEGEVGPVEGLEPRILGSEEGTSAGRMLVRRVRGELVNRRERALVECGVKVYYLKPDGRPHLTDVSAELTRRATFNWVYPVLSGATPPLAPGARVTFTVDVPLSFDPEDKVRPEDFGASVLSARFER